MLNFIRFLNWRVPILYIFDNKKTKKAKSQLTQRPTAVIPPCSTTSFAGVGRSSDHLVRCRSWRYSKRITPRSVVYTKSYMRQRTNDLQNLHFDIGVLEYILQRWFLHQNLHSTSERYTPISIYYIGKNVTEFNILHRRLSLRIVSVLLPYSGVTTGFFHGGWGSPFF